MGSRRSAAVAVLGLILSIESGGAVSSENPLQPSAGLLGELTRVLPPIVLDIEAEGDDVEATVSITVLDRVPDMRGLAGAVRRLLPAPR